MRSSVSGGTGGLVPMIAAAAGQIEMSIPDTVINKRQAGQGREQRWGGGFMFREQDPFRQEGVTEFPAKFAGEKKGGPSLARLAILSCRNYSALPGFAAFSARTGFSTLAAWDLFSVTGGRSPGRITDVLP